MEQQVQTKPTTEPQVAQQPVANQQPTGQAQPTEGQVKTSVWKKWWFWLIIVGAVILVGVGVYFLAIK